MTCGRSFIRVWNRPCPLMCNRLRQTHALQTACVFLLFREAGSSPRPWSPLFTEWVSKLLGRSQARPKQTDLRRRKLPDLAVVDIKLRDEMTSSLILNMHNEGIRVVAVSGYTQFPGPTEHIAAILQKPFSESEFLATMLGVLGNDHT